MSAQATTCRSLRAPGLVCAAVVAALGAGCISTGPTSSALFERVGRSDVTYDELRIKVRDLARRFPAVLEQAADEMARSSGSEEVRARLVSFKADAIPALQGALFQPDPVAALLDGWSLIAQLRLALPQRASGVPPEVVATADGALGGLEDEMEALWRELTGLQDVSAVRTRVHGWAAAHPLIGLPAARESTAPLLAGETERSGVGLLGAAAGALETTRDLSARLDLYTATLPRQARWEAERFTDDVLRRPEVARALSELSVGMAAMGPIGRLTADAPALVEREREAILGQIHEERVAALDQAEGMATRTVDHAFDRAGGLLDRLFLGLAALGALGLVAVLGTVAILRAWDARHHVEQHASR